MAMDFHVRFVVYIYTYRSIVFDSAVRFLIFPLKTLNEKNQKNRADNATRARYARFVCITFGVLQISSGGVRDDPRAEQRTGRATKNGVENIDHVCV